MQKGWEVWKVRKRIKGKEKEGWEEKRMKGNEWKNEEIKGNEKASENERQWKWIKERKERKVNESVGNRE